MIALAIRNDEMVQLNLASMGIRVRDRVRTDVTRLTIQLQAKVKADKLSGQVLHVRTGRLRRSINALVRETPTSVVGQVGTNVPYGTIHEYGGTVTVRAHMRQQTMVFGHPIVPITVAVAAHTATLPERSFLRSALREMRPQILATLRAGVAEATR